MKTKYKLLPLLLCGVMALSAVTACSDDKDEIIILEEPEYPALSVDTESMRVKIGADSRMAIPVSDGAGEYAAFSLNPDIADVTDENGVLMVEGFRNGSTEIIISDKGGSLKKLPVSVYTTDVLTVETTDFTLETPLGHSATATTKILLGNDGYSAVSDNDAVKASVDEEGVVSITATSKRQEFTAKVTVSDISGLTADIMVTVKYTLDAFTPQDIATLCAQTEESMADFNGDKPYRFSYYRENFNTSVKNGIETFGWIGRSGRYELFVTYPEGTALNTPVQGTVTFTDNYDEKAAAQPATVTLVKNDEISKVAIFSYIDEQQDKLCRGYLVHVLADSGW